MAVCFSLGKDFGVINRALLLLMEKFLRILSIAASLHAHDANSGHVLFMY